MATKNDSTIMTLKAKIAEKKKNLGVVAKFVPVTTCIFNLNGEKVNIHTMDKAKAMFYLVQFKSMITAAKEIPDVFPEKVMLDGFSIVEWYSDLLSRFNQLNHNEKRAELAALETKLDALLSNDKKVELEIADIAKLLG